MATEQDDSRKAYEQRIAAGLAADDKEGALALQTQLLENMERTSGPEHPGTVTVRSELALMLGGLERHSDATVLWAQQVEIHLRNDGPDHPHTLNVQLALERSKLYESNPLGGDLENALTQQKELVAQAKRDDGQYSLKALAAGFIELEMLSRLQRSAETVALEEELVELSTRLLGPRHLQTLNLRMQLGASQIELGDAAAAGATLTQTAADFEATLGKQHEGTVGSVSNLVRALIQQTGNAATPDVTQAKTKKVCHYMLLLTDCLPAGTEKALRAQMMLARFLVGADDQEEALEVMSKLVEKVKISPGAEHPVYATVLEYYATMLYGAGLADRASEQQHEVCNARREALGPEHEDTLAAIDRLANMLENDGHVAKAIPLYRELLDVHRRTLGTDHTATLETQQSLVDALVGSSGGLGEAEQLLRELLAVLEETLGEDHRDTISLKQKLGSVSLLQHKYAEAETFLRDALERWRRTLGEDAQNTYWSLKGLVVALAKQPSPDKQNEARWYAAELDRLDPRGSDDYPADALSTEGDQASAHSYDQEQDHESGPKDEVGKGNEEEEAEEGATDKSFSFKIHFGSTDPSIQDIIWHWLDLEALQRRGALSQRSTTYVAGRLKADFQQAQAGVSEHLIRGSAGNVCEQVGIQRVRDLIHRFQQRNVECTAELWAAKGYEHESIAIGATFRLPDAHVAEPEARDERWSEQTAFVFLAHPKTGDATLVEEVLCAWLAANAPPSAIVTGPSTMYYIKDVLFLRYSVARPSQDGDDGTAVVVPDQLSKDEDAVEDPADPTTTWAPEIRSLPDVTIALLMQKGATSAAAAARRALEQIARIQALVCDRGMDIVGVDTGTGKVMVPANWGSM